MTIEQILALETTKTEKMIFLFQAGKTRSEVATLLGVGYGFVQNVWARQNSTRPRVQNQTQQAFNFDSKFGVEIEAFNVSRVVLRQALLDAGINVESESYNHDTRNHWKIVNDGSVSGQNAFELVSPPLQGLDGLAELERVCAVLEQLDVKVNKSCGMHIHFEATNFSLSTWRNIYANYATLEGEIDSIMPNSRRGNNNNYCKSIVSYKEQIRNARSIRIISTIVGSSRYYKVNCQSFWRHRTIEFRQHSGTIEYRKISNWILILAQLIHASKQRQLESGTALGDVLQPTQQEYVCSRKLELN